MPIIDDTSLLSEGTSFEIVNPVGRRTITHALHDVDGTHSLIREWPPVMSLSIHYAMTSGLADDFDSDTNLALLVERVGKEPLPETDEFCVESAGLSALTQMEYGIRRAVELNNLPDDVPFQLTSAQLETNSQIVKRIWKGEERFDELAEPEDFSRFVADRSVRLFQLYEKVLNGACRDKNTADAWNNPERWRVNGALEFMTRLRDLGCINYFVTGAVLYEDGGMFEEVKAVGFKTGPGEIVEKLMGSSWDKKQPKDEIMRALLEKLSVDPTNVLVVGDGRTEIAAGAAMGCISMSRLPADANRQRELHRQLGTNYIIEDYTPPQLEALLQAQ